MTRVAARLDGIGEYYFSQKLAEIAELNKAGAAVINLGIGSPDLPPHPSVIEVLCDEAVKPTVHSYQSYRGAETLRNAFSEWYNRYYGVKLNPSTEILPLMGSKEGILHICMTYLNQGDVALIPNPGYPTYRSAVELAGGSCLEYEISDDKNGVIDFDALARQDLSRVKLMWVNFPHMPTGRLPQPGLFKNLVGFGNKHGILICHDNPYSFILNDKPESLLSVPGAKDIVLELNSLSKSHNMAGWRVGVLCGAAERVSEVLRFKSNMDSGMFLPVQLAAAKALELGPEWYESLNAVYKSRRAVALQLLQHLRCTCEPHQAGLFVWARIPADYKNSFEMSDAILQKTKVFITPGGIFGTAGQQFLRISLCSPVEKLEESIQRIKKMFS